MSTIFPPSREPEFWGFLRRFGKTLWTKLLRVRQALRKRKSVDMADFAFHVTRISSGCPLQISTTKRGIWQFRKCRILQFPLHRLADQKTASIPKPTSKWIMNGQIQERNMSPIFPQSLGGLSVSFWKNFVRKIRLWTKILWVWLASTKWWVKSQITSNGWFWLPRDSDFFWKFSLKTRSNAGFYNLIRKPS